MLAMFVAITAVISSVVLIVATLALIAEYEENPVIEIVEEYRKKYGDINEN